MSHMLLPCLRKFVQSLMIVVCFHGIYNGGRMKKLEGFQKKFLRGLAHSLKPVVFIGQKGLVDSVVRSLSEAFDAHELIKVKFIEYKEKSQKKEISAHIEKKTGGQMAGMIGHTAIFFKQHPDPEKRKIAIPQK